MAKRIMQKDIIDQKILSKQHDFGAKKVTDLVKNRGGCRKQQHSNFGAKKLYDQQAYHGNEIHIMEVDMMLNNMQLESLNSDKRSRHTRRPKLQQNNSFQHNSTLTSGSPLWSKI